MRIENDHWHFLYKDPNKTLKISLQIFRSDMSIAQANHLDIQRSPSLISNKSYVP